MKFLLVPAWAKRAFESAGLGLGQASNLEKVSDILSPADVVKYLQINSQVDKYVGSGFAASLQPALGVCPSELERCLPHYSPEVIRRIRDQFSVSCDLAIAKDNEKYEDRRRGLRDYADESKDFLREWNEVWYGDPSRESFVGLTSDFTEADTLVITPLSPEQCTPDLTPHQKSELEAQFYERVVSQLLLSMTLEEVARLPVFVRYLEKCRIM